MTESTIKQRQLQILDIFKNFNFFPKVSNALLKSYTERKGYDMLTAGEYEDHLYQYQHDERALVIVPKLLELLQRYQYTPDYIGDAEKARIKKENAELEMEMADICAQNGLEYREIDAMIKNFGEVLNAIFSNTAQRMNNMCGTVIATVAQEHFDNGLKVSELAKWYRERAGGN